MDRQQTVLDFEKGGSHWLAHGQPPGGGLRGLVCSHSLNPTSNLAAAAIVSSGLQLTGEDQSSLPLDLLLAQKVFWRSSFSLCPLSSPVTEYDGPPRSMFPASLLSATLAGECLLIIIFAVHWSELDVQKIGHLLGVPWRSSG